MTEWPYPLASAHIFNISTCTETHVEVLHVQARLAASEADWACVGVPEAHGYSFHGLKESSILFLLNGTP